MYYIVAQAVGFIGAGLLIFSYQCKDSKRIRMANLFVNSPAWLIYDIYTVSYSGILCEIFTLISVIVSFFRYGMKDLDHAD